jgi:hypothetical protein
MLDRVVRSLKSSAMVAAMLALTACAGSPVASGDVNKLTGDENGGKISEALGPAQSQSVNLSQPIVPGTARKVSSPKWTTTTTR